MVGEEDPGLGFFRRRVRLGTWWLLISTAVIALGEVAVRAGEHPEVTAIQFGAVLLEAALLPLLPRLRTRRQLTIAALTLVLFASSVSVAIAVATGNAATSLIVLAALSLIPAVFVPWGWQPQTVVALFNGAAYPIELVLAEGVSPIAHSRPVFGLLVVAAGSVYAAYELDRQRRLTQAEQRERLAHEQALERQRAFLRQVVDINPHLIFAKDRVGRFTFVNRAVAEVYGTTVEGLTGRTDADFNPKLEEVEHFRRDDLRVIDSGAELVIPEEQITDASGQTRWLRTIKRRLATLDGSPNQVLGVATDITEHRQAQAGLQENAEVSSALAGIGREIIASLNQPDRLQHLCRLTREALGGDSVQMWILDADGQNWVPTCHAGEPPERWETIQLLPLPLSLLAPYVEVADRTGADFFPIETLGAPLLRLTPGIRGVISIALRRGGATVGTLVVKYTTRSTPPTGAELRVARGISQLASLAIENARLHEQAERANRLKTEFMATMSHELRTPLNVIIGYCDLLREGAMGALGTEQAETLERVHENALQLLDLINATLDVSRLESGEVPLDLREVDLGEVLADVEVRTREIGREDRPNLSVRLPADLGPFVTDGAKLRMILTNLVGNALKFTREGQVTVSARGEEQSVEITIRDTGMGIPEELQDVVFEPFRQADETVRQRFGGVGLGLFIVKRLLDVLGGEIDLESMPGVGTTFRIRLPRSPSPRGGMRAPGEATGPPGGRAPARLDRVRASLPNGPSASTRPASSGSGPSGAESDQRPLPRRRRA